MELNQANTTDQSKYSPAFTSIISFAKQHLAGLFCLQLIVTGIYGSFTPYTATGTFYRFITCLLLITWFFAGLNEKVWCRAFKSIPCLFLFAYFLISSLSILNASSPSLSADYLEGRLYLIISILILMDIKHEEHFISWIKQSFEVIIVLSLCYGFYQVYIGLPFLRELNLQQSESTPLFNERLNWRLQSSEMFSTYLYANLFSHFVFLALLILPLWIKEEKTKFIKISVLTLALLCAAWHSQAKGPPVAFFIAIVTSYSIYLIQSRKINHLLGIIIATLAILTLFWNKLSSLGHDSLFIRHGYLQSSLSMVFEHPLGVGINNYSEHYMQHMGPLSTEVKMAHNDPLQVLCETGWIGFIVYLGIFISLIILFLKNKTSFETHTTKRLPIWPILTTLCFIVVAYKYADEVTGPFDIKKLGLVFLIVLTAILAVFWSSNSKERSFRLSKWVPITLVVYFLAHSCLDFPFYDHSISSLFFIIIFTFLPNKENTNPFKPAFLFITFIFILGAVWTSITRHQNLIEFDQLELVQDIDQESLASIISKCQLYPNELKPWHSTLLMMLRLPKSYQSADGQAHLKTVIDKIIELRPRSANANLLKARRLGLSKEAEFYFKRTIELYPRKAKFYLHYAIFLSDKGREAEAKLYANQAQERHEYADKMSKKQIDFKLLTLDQNEKIKLEELLKLLKCN